MTTNHGGLFQPGKSGNPGGRPGKRVRATVNGVEGDYTVGEICAPHSQEAIETLVAVMQDTKAPHPSRVTAANFILDRVFGKPKQSVEMAGEDGAPIEVSLRGGVSGLLTAAKAALSDDSGAS